MSQKRKLSLQKKVIVKLFYNNCEKIYGGIKTDLYVPYNNNVGPSTPRTCPNTIIEITTTM